VCEIQRERERERGREREGERERERERERESKMLPLFQNRTRLTFLEEYGSKS